MIMASHRTLLSGVFAPVVTPFRDGEPDLGALRSNLRKLAKTGLTGYLALGSNGEFMSLSDSEQMSVLAVFAEEKADKVVMVGTARESSKHTIAFTNDIIEMGFEYASVLTPHYFAKQMNGTKLNEYYQRVADNSGMPVLLYNAPGFAGGVQIPPETVVELSSHPNIAGMKDSSPTGPGKFLSIIDPEANFAILAGSANFMYPSLHLGSPGGIVSLANYLPEPPCRMYRLFIEGAFDKARELHDSLARINKAVAGAYGVAGVKAAMSMAGFDGGEPRHPLLPVNEDDRTKIRDAFLSEGYGGSLVD